MLLGDKHKPDARHGLYVREDEVVRCCEGPTPEDLGHLVLPRHMAGSVPGAVPQEALGMRLQLEGVGDGDRPVAGPPHPVQLRNGVPIDLVREGLIPGVEEEVHVGQPRLFCHLRNQRQDQLEVGKTAVLIEPAGAPVAPAMAPRAALVEHAATDDGTYVALREVRSDRPAGLLQSLWLQPVVPPGLKGLLQHFFVHTAAQRARQAPHDSVLHRGPSSGNLTAGPSARHGGGKVHIAAAPAKVRGCPRSPGSQRRPSGRRGHRGRQRQSAPARVPPQGGTATHGATAEGKGREGSRTA
mmetsp:Transcript_41166/g.128310  ORF Transcript_41166/g.128310 Transcript_41166/m.128310 type:complete len:298 (+) Transcript_41166:661-1554(+)